MHLRFLSLACLPLLFWGQLTPVRAQSERHELEQVAMGVNFRFILYHADPEVARRLLADAARRVAELDQALSDYREQSETNRLCRSAPHAIPQAVSPDLFRVLERGLGFSQLTGNAFDVTVGPASHAWRKAIKRNRLPEAEKLETLRTAIGSHRVRLVPPDRVQLLAPDMQLDFGGIAQGDAADQIADLFRAAGVTSALIDASGDVLALGAPPGAAGWPIEIPGLDGAESTTILLRDAAVSTSGDREQRLVVEGVRYSHIIDPRTARAVKQSVQATVIAPSATAADALASALCVLTPDEGLALIAPIPGTATRLQLPSTASPPAGQGDSESLLRESPNFREFIRPRPER
ncbi:MAG: FAD:protein FMN transferase [Planctomycetota bacterium]